MAVVPYMPFYVADYLADTSHLTTVEHGAYVLLILAYWQQKKPLRTFNAGSTDVERINDRLASVARMSNDDWRKIRPVLAEFFTESDGYWHHKRIDLELSRLQQKTDQASRAGRASAERRFNGRSADVERPLNHARVVEPPFNHSDTDTGSKQNSSGYKEPVVGGAVPNPPPNGTGFEAHDLLERLYSAHPKKADRGLALTYLSQSLVAGADPKEIERVHGLYCVEVWAKDKPQFVPKLAQWLLDQNWKYPPNGHANGNGHGKPEVCPGCKAKPCECAERVRIGMQRDAERVAAMAKERSQNGKV